ncbi:MAG: alpha-E domain-containing protein [Rhodospirillales bacterium]
MLSSTADNLFWMARYMERSENTARLLTGLYHMSLLPARRGAQAGLWEGLFQSVDERDAYLAKYDAFKTDPVLTYMVLDRANPSSIRSCVWSARENVRATRHVLTTDMWETINSTWLDIAQVTYADMLDMGHHEFLEWIKVRSHLFRGVAHGTMRRGDAFEFWRMGVFIERAENTIRLLAARAHTFKPTGPVSREDTATLDYYQWGTLLRSVNAYKAYREIYKSQIDPRRVVELLTLNAEIPRSVMACVEEICEVLGGLRPRSRSAEQAGDLLNRLQSARIDRVYRTGMARFLEDYRGGLHDLSLQIQKDFLMIQ